MKYIFDVLLIILNATMIAILGRSLGIVKGIDSFLRESQMQWRSGDKFRDTTQTFAELA